MEYLLLVSGIVALILSGEALVKGAVKLATRYNISSMVIGLTVVAFGTSAPELLVSVKSALQNHPEIAVGNVLGSNVANITLVLGVSVMLMPITIVKSIIRNEWLIMFLATLAFAFYVQDYTIQRWEGILFIIALVAYNVYILKSAKGTDTDVEYCDDKSSILMDLIFIAVGVVGLALGSSWLIDGAIEISRNFGVSEYAISATVVAFGTSVPELATSIIAASKKETDISLGNLIGSNIFNLFAVIGVTSTVTEIPVGENVLSSELYWVIGAVVLLLPLMYYKQKLTRIKGVLLFSFYLLYVYNVLL